MKFGFVLPFGDARTAADLAYTAEQAGWDGFFVREPVWGYDAWVLLAAPAHPDLGGGCLATPEFDAPRPALRWTSAERDGR